MILIILAGLAWATPVDQPSPLELAVLAEINRVRSDPRGFADELRAYRRTFEGRIAYPRGYPDGIQTSEGSAAVDDAIAYLDAQPPQLPLVRSSVLAQSVAALVIDQGVNGGVGHLGSDGRNPSSRTVAVGGGPYVGEVIAYGPPDAQSVVRQLIVDDGVPGRGHRILLFSARFRFGGATCGPHPKYRIMCAVDMSSTSDGQPVRMEN